jgi:splicing factor 4
MFAQSANASPVEFRSGPVADRAGLGTEKPGEIGAEDDEFEAYRKRMMLAYRFRPNPLVGGAILAGSLEPR